MRITDAMVEAGCRAAYPELWDECLADPLLTGPLRSNMRRALAAALSASEELTALREAVEELDGAPWEDRVGFRVDVLAAVRAVAL